MKKIILASLTLFLSFNLLAQSKVNLVVFSEDGDKFYLVINGIRQNMTAETNVKVTDLTTESFSFKIIFDDTKNEAISKTQYLPFGYEYTFRIKTDKKGKKVMKPFGQTELSQPSVNTASTTVVYHTEETPVATTNTNTNTVNTNTNVGSNGVSTSVNVGGNTTESTTTTTTTTTTTSGNNGVGTTVNVNENMNTGTNENVSVGMNVGGVGMNIDINVSENGVGTNMTGSGTENVNTSTNVSNNGTSTSTYSSTTTTTTTTTGGNINTNLNVNENTNTTNTGTTTTGTTYTGTSNYACGAAMKTTDFEDAKKSISSKSFEDSKFTVAKQVTKNNCLSSAQIKEVMALFDFEDTKLDYAKFAYDYCYDKNNYYKLNDAFDFESSVDELNSYLEKK